MLAQRTPVQGYTLWRIASDNSLTSLVAVPGLKSVSGGADISHDGTRIAYVVAAAPSGLTELRVIDVATGGITVLEPIVSFPGWSNNDDRIAYVAQDGLAVRNADGTGRRLVSTQRMAGRVGWSLDASYLVGLLNGSAQAAAMLFVRVSDGADVLLKFRNATGTLEQYMSADWR